MAVGCGGGGGGDGGPPTITSVVISGDSTVVLAGTRQLDAAAFSGGTPVNSGVTFQWSSSDTTRATVSSTGLVSGVRLGSATITALAVLNGTATAVSATHAVRSRIGAIVITGNAPFASLGDSALLTADARDARNASVSGLTFAWQSRTAAVASATPRSGTAQADVVALANGTSQIVVTANGVSDSVTATVQQVATSLAISPDTVTFGRIDSVLTPAVTASDARGNPITGSALAWTTENSAVATVDPASGAVQSKNEGHSRVVGSSGSLSDTIRVGVALIYKSVQIATTGALPAPLDSGLINKLNGSLQLGLIVQDSGNTTVPNPQGITWSLKRGTIASISASGLVSGNTNTGRDTIVVAARTVRDSIPLIVRQVLASIAVTPANHASLNFTGDTAQFAAEPRDSGGAAIPGLTIAWSTNNSVLGIDQSGLATAGRSSATGFTVRVRAATGGITDSSTTIVVKQVPASANLAPNSFGTFTTLGRSVQASCVVLDSASDTIPNHPCNWSAVTANVVSFNPVNAAHTTTITAVGDGTTTIKAQAATSLFGFNSVTVDQVPASVSIIPQNRATPDVQMTTSQSAPFFAVVRDAGNNVDPRPRNDVTWAAAPGSHLSVSGSVADTVTVSTTSAGTDTVKATVGSLSAKRAVGVVASGVSFAASIQGLLNNTCARVGCHGGSTPQEGLNLSTASSYTALVNTASTELPTMKRVHPLMPDSSYMVHKIQGTQLQVGGLGVQMPEGCSGASCLPNTTIDIIRNWVLQGAKNN